MTSPTHPKSVVPSAWHLVGTEALLPTPFVLFSWVSSPLLSSPLLSSAPGLLCLAALTRPRAWREHATVEATHAERGGSVWWTHTHGPAVIAGQQQPSSVPAASWRCPQLDTFLPLPLPVLCAGLQHQVEPKSGSLHCQAGCGAGLCCTWGRVSWSQLCPGRFPCPSLLLSGRGFARHQGAPLPGLS